MALPLGGGVKGVIFRRLSGVKCEALMKIREKSETEQQIHILIHMISDYWKKICKSLATNFAYEQVLLSFPSFPFTQF